MLLFSSSVCYCYNNVEEISTCSTCEHFIDTARVFLEKGNSTIVPMIKVISQICHKIYGPAAKECYLITNNTDEWIQDVLHNSSYTVCQQMSQC